MLTKKLSQLPHNRAIRLNNLVCAYCGCKLSENKITKEHVVGRRFVPKGKLNQNWNLIVNACEPCNNLKSDLENDISAITLQPDITGINPNYDSQAIAEAQRKALNSISRRTKRPVRDSQETIKFGLPIGKNGKVSFDFKSPAQIDETRAFELSRLQLAGFFHFITYQKDQDRGYYWTGGYHPLLMVRRSDFGHPIAVDFADAVIGWEPRVLAHTAEGYFGLCIRRHPEADCWSWAIEWNGSTRLMGFLGDEVAAKAIVGKLGPLKVNHQDLPDGRYIRFRLESPLDPENDRLFYWGS